MENQTPKRRLPSAFRWIIWVLLVQFVLFNISAAFYAYKFTHVYDDPALRHEPPNKNIFIKTWRLFTGPRQPRSVITESPVFPIDTVILKTQNGVLIDAWYAKPDSAAKGTVILFHGIGANKGMLIPEASEFLYLGYNILLVDLRAHGNSGGHTTTIGVIESEEVKLAYDYVLQQGEKNIFLYGSSMGAVVVAKAIADYDLKLAGAILEMPFASLQSHLRARARVQGFEAFTQRPFAFMVTFWIGLERGFNGFKHQTARYGAKINCPVLMQAGAIDEYVLKYETDEVYSAIASPQKKLVMYDRAGHESLLRNDPAKWRIEIEQFFLANTK